MTAIKSQNRLFSIVIPTWNNLAFLKLCIQSIQRNSYYNHQIIVHVNDGSDGTLEWIKKAGIDYTHSEQNINPEKPDMPLNKNDAFQKLQKRRVQEKR